MEIPKLWGPKLVERICKLYSSGNLDQEYMLECEDFAAFKETFVADLFKHLHNDVMEQLGVDILLAHCVISEHDERLAYQKTFTMRWAPSHNVAKFIGGPLDGSERALMEIGKPFVISEFPFYADVMRAENRTYEYAGWDPVSLVWVYIYEREEDNGNTGL